MGLLDDAIREHLELRRRAGADASEVANMEQEALGPVVRGATPSADPAIEPDPALTEEDEHQMATDDPSEVEQPAAEPVAYEEAPSEAAEQDWPPEAPSLPDAQALAPHAHDLDPPPLPAEPPAPVGEQEQYVAPAGAGQPTEEYDVDAAHAAPATGPPPSEQPVPSQPPVDAPPAADAEPASARPAESGAHPGETPAGEPTVGEDVLEQTPEFLEETPEHDRLWFEQAPPKDFDFDK